MPGGTELCFGVFIGQKLVGVMTLGAGPYLAYQLVESAEPRDCLTLTRMWLSEGLPRNSESHVLGMMTKSLRRFTKLKFLVTYADPSKGHVGTIYQAANWLFTGLSEPMPLYDLGDGLARHSRSLAHALGSHSVRYLESQGITLKLSPLQGKYRYIYFINPAWRSLLRSQILPYPKKGQS